MLLRRGTYDVALVSYEADEITVDGGNDRVLCTP